MLKKLIITVAISLLLGGGIGYLVGSGKDHPGVQTTSESPAMMHGASPDAMVQELKDKSGSARDEAFLESMIVHHQSAVAMSEVLLESTKRPELQKLANDIIAAQTTEIEMMKGWLNAWYGR